MAETVKHKKDQLKTELTRAVKALRQIAGIDPWEDSEKGYVDLARSALPARVQGEEGIVDTIEAFDRDHPELYWHIGKGKITTGEPLYGAIITDLMGNELGDGDSNVSAIDAFSIAVEDAGILPAEQ